MIVVFDWIYCDYFHDVLHFKPSGLFYVMWTQSKFYLRTAGTVVLLNWLRDECKPWSHSLRNSLIFLLLLLYRVSYSLQHLLTNTASPSECKYKFYAHKYLVIMVRLISHEKLKMGIQLTDRSGCGGHENMMVFVPSFREMQRKKPQQRGHVCIYIYIYIYPFIHMFHDPKNIILLKALSRLVCSLWRRILELREKEATGFWKKKSSAIRTSQFVFV
jgi:hypothetical protein